MRIEHIDEKHTKQRKDANMRLYIVYISLETAVTTYNHECLHSAIEYQIPYPLSNNSFG